MKFNYNGKPAQLAWYTQDLITASLDSIYGNELLCRGWILDGEAPIPMRALIPYLYNNTELLLKMTCRQISDICRTNHNSNVTTWINLAGQLIASDELFYELWRSVLGKLSLKQKRSIVLEICEDDVNDEIVVRRVSWLHEKGFVIAMDDFGSGHSNLLRLHQTSFDIIKLDFKLLHNIPDDLWAASFYREVVNLCSSTGCLIVAEGVETQSQSDFVRWAGVDLIQGYLYSTPKMMPSLSSSES